MGLLKIGQKIWAEFTANVFRVEINAQKSVQITMGKRDGERRNWGISKNGKREFNITK